MHLIVKYEHIHIEMNDLSNLINSEIRIHFLSGPHTRINSG